MIEGTASKDCAKDNSSSSLTEYCGDNKPEFLYRVSSGGSE